MEPDTLIEFKNFLAKELQQKFIVSNTGEELKDYVNEYLDALAKVDSLKGSIYGSTHYWKEQNKVKQPIGYDYIEAIEDTDLGLVRKINLK